MRYDKLTAAINRRLAERGHPPLTESGAACAALQKLAEKGGCLHSLCCASDEGERLRLYRLNCEIRREMDAILAGVNGGWVWASAFELREAGALSAAIANDIVLAESRCRLSVSAIGYALDARYLLNEYTSPLPVHALRTLYLFEH